MHDDGVHGGGDRADEGTEPSVPEQPRPSARLTLPFAPGPQAVLTPATASAGAGTAAAPGAATAPAGQSESAAPSAEPSPPPRARSAVAVRRLLLAAGVVGALLAIGIGALLAVSVLASGVLGPHRLPHRPSNADR